MSLDRPAVSVCMATYNGEAYVEEQLASILAQLAPTDEVVVVDDASTDGTAERVRAMADARITLTVAPANRGYVRTFEHALRLAAGDHVYLADQDDVWTPGRVEAMSRSLATHDVVATNLATLGVGDGLRGPFGQPDWRLRSDGSRRHVRNLLGILAGNRPYYGCAMAVRREALDAILPFPAYLTESHDLWIAVYGNVARSIEHLELRSLERRLHGDNQTPTRPRGIAMVLRSRLMLLRAVADLHRRSRRGPAGPAGSRSERVAG